MENIEVKNCFTCPFMSVEYDEFSVGDDVFMYCALKTFLNINGGLLKTYSRDELDDEMYDENDKEIKSIDEVVTDLDDKDCPLKTNDFKISLKK